MTAEDKLAFETKDRKATRALNPIALVVEEGVDAMSIPANATVIKTNSRQVMTANNRPLSPHVQVYRLPLTGLCSIIHRITGMLLSLGLVLVVYLLVAIAMGEGAYADLQAVTGFWLFKAVYWGFVYALFFHLCHGVRHLIWDVGKSFERATLNRYAGYELAASLALTLTVLFLI